MIDSTAKTTLLAEETPDMVLQSWLNPYIWRLISSGRPFCSRVIYERTGQDVNNQ